MEPSRRRRAAHAAPRPALLEWIACGVPLLLGLVLRLWLAARNSGLTMDSPLYVNMADGLASGRREVLGPAHHGYPALIALAHAIVPGRELPGRLVALLAGLLLTGLVYALARRTLRPGWAALAASLVSLHPLLAVYSVAIMTETTFLALLYGGLLLVEAGHEATGGALVGLGYWVRPESIVLAPAVALFGSKGWRSAARILAAAALAGAPYLLLLHWEYGAWRLTPKDVLVAPAQVVGHERDITSGPLEEPPSPSLIQRVREAAPSTLSGYLPNLGEQCLLLLTAWPWPLMLVSLLGIWRRGGALRAPLVYLAFLPLLAVRPSGRFHLILLPALAVFHAAGAAALLAWIPERRRVAAAAAACGVALLGLVLCWNGGAGLHALFFDDGPMRPMREAGRWLLDNGTPAAVVADRKPYVPFFAHMRHVPLPGDDYETVIRWAVRSRIDYLVLEEYTVLTMRRKMLGLVTSPEFRAAEHRLHVIYDRREGRKNGVWIFEVVQDSSMAGAGAPARPDSGHH